MIRNHFIFIVCLILFLENELLSIQLIHLNDIIIFVEIFNSNSITVNFDLLFALIFLFYLQVVIIEQLMSLHFSNFNLLIDLIPHEFLIFF
jgi:hypothetical protein